MATIPVHAGDNLQTALNTAVGGDSIVLDAGATFTGEFTLPSKVGSSVITVTSAATLPNRRIGPGDASLMPLVRSGTVNSPITGTGVSAHWRLDGLQLESNSSGQGAVVALQDSNDIYLDRLLIVAGASGQHRAILGNGTNITLTRSYLANIFSPIGQDSQAFAAWDGAGPYTVTDNYLEAASENIMFGGALSASAANTPADILIDGNHCFKPLSWVGQNKAVKNLFELKNAKRVAIRHNVFENNFTDAQTGWAIVLTPRGDSGHWAVVEDVVFEQNVITGTERGFSIAGYDTDPVNGGAGPSGRCQRVTVRNNLWVTQFGWLQIGSETGQLTIDHNTVDNGSTVCNFYRGTVWPLAENLNGSRPATFACSDLTFTNNLTTHNNFGVIDEIGGIGTPGLTAACTVYSFLDNVLAGGAGQTYPLTTQLPDVTSYRANFTDFAGGTYTLIPSSLYKNAGTDGLDLGTSWFGTPTTTLPPPWTNQDIGAVGLAGTSTYSAGTFSMAGAGANVGSTVDAFQYLYQSILNDTQIICHVATAGATDPFSRVGVMLRTSSAADAAHIMLGIRPGGPNQVAMVTRATSGDITTIVNSIPWATVVWFKLTRIASTVTGYISADGLNWTTVGSLASPVPAAGLLGMIVLSNDVAQLNTATFDAVTVGITVALSDAFEVWVYV